MRKMGYNAFRKQRIILGAFGLSLPGDIKKRWLQNLVDAVLVVNMFFMGVWSFLFIRGAILYTRLDLLQRMTGLAGAISYISVVAKLVTFRLNGDTLLQLINDLGHMKADTKLGKTVRKMTNIYEGAVAVIILTHNSEYWTHSVPTRQALYYTESKTGELGEVTRDYFFCLYGAVSILATNVIGDTLFVILCSQLCYRIHRLSNSIPYIGKEWPADDKEVISIGQKPEVNEVLRACIKEHAFVLKSTKQIEDLYNNIFLCQLLYSYLSICVTLFTVSQYENIAKGIQEMFPQVVSLFLEIFLYCWGGQMISNQYERLHFAIYDSGWTECSEEVKSSVLLMETLSAQPRVITSGSVFHLTYAFFETICRETFSAYTIMYQFLG